MACPSQSDYCATRGGRPSFDLSGTRLSGAAGGLAPNACATSIISGAWGLSDPCVILTPFVVSTCVAEAAGSAGVWPTLAVVSGATIFGGAGKTSTFATANGSPATGKSCRGSIMRPTAVATIATPAAVPLIGRLRPWGSAKASPVPKPSGSFSSSHTSVGALALNVLELRINLAPAYSRSPLKASFLFISDARGASLPSNLWS